MNTVCSRKSQDNQPIFRVFLAHLPLKRPKFFSLAPPALACISFHIVQDSARKKTRSRVSRFVLCGEARIKHVHESVTFEDLESTRPLGKVWGNFE